MTFTDERKEQEMEFIFGCICGAAAAVICALGVKPPPAKRPREDAPSAAAAEDAFRQLQNYSAEQAYGMGGERGCIR
jgi:hypothetical protein